MQRKTIPLIGAMLAALAAIGLAALVVWNQLSGSSDRAARGDGEAVVAPGLEVGGDFELVNHKGETVTQNTFEGGFMLVYFGYSSCPDVCPTELSSMAAAIDILAERDAEAAQQITPVLITIDPARDTVEVLKDYAPAFHPRLVGLTGSDEEIDKIARKYRVYYARGQQIDDEFYLMNHSGYVYLMGPDGDFITMFHGGTDPESIANALQRYVAAAATS
ncbi:MAG: SCO family protein [Alphaproteobacteria bacterium]|nr:SCO family protein [Alphaproteobacteria bacterium]